MRPIYKILYRFCSILIVLLSQFAFAQNFLDKDYYLIDSLKESNLKSQEKELIDSALSIFHQSDQEIEKLEALEILTGEVRSADILSKYNSFRLNYCFHRMFASLISEDDRKAFFSSFSRGVLILGTQELDKGNPLKSLDYFWKAIDFLKGKGKAEDFALAYTNIGTNYFHQGEVEQSQIYLKLAYDSLYETTNHDLMASALNNLAVIHQEKGQIDSSLKYHFKSLNLAIKEGNKPGEAMSYNNIGGIYAETIPDSLQKGIQYLHMALDIFKALEIEDWSSFTYHKLALAYLKANQFEKAEKNSNYALLYANQANISQPMLRAYATIYRVKKKMGKKGEALTYYEKYVNLKDSLSNSDIKVASAQKELEYQYKTEKNLAEKENEKRLALEKSERERQQTLIYWISAFIALTLIFAIVQLGRNRKIRKQNDVIEKQSEERKILLKEIHHRVKNNFQIICSVLRLQAYDENNPVIDAAFEDAVNRIQSMAEVHEMIYKEEAFSTINPEDYFNRLTNSIQHLSYDRKIEYLISSEFDDLPMEVIISLGISVNELITNSIKHAFQNSDVNPQIKISIMESDGQGVLSYQDNGIGYDAKSVQESFGTELIKTIIEQINGQLQYRTTEKGSEVVIGFMIQN